MNTSPSIRYLPAIDADSLSQQLSDWRVDGNPFHVLALVADAERANIPRLQQCFIKAGIDLAGAIFPALITEDSFKSHGLVLLRITDAPRPLMLCDVSRPEAPAAVADALLDHVLSRLSDDEDATLFCIFDALVPNIATHLDEWYLKLADRVRYTGVNAGNETFQPAPCLFDSKRFVQDALLVQLLPGHPGATLEHAYGVPQTVISATSSAGNRIIQINWQPALAAYQKILADEYGVPVDRDNFYQHAVHFPFGILRADGEVLVRIPVALDDKDAIICVGEIPPNAVLTLLDGRSGMDRAVPALLARPHNPQDATLLFYCAGRRMHAGTAADLEIAALHRARPGTPLLGALSLGEIGGSRSGGYPLFHNATLVDLPWPG